MSLREIVDDLRKQGHRVSYTARNDGSIIIHSIDGKTFKKKEGNKEARELIGIDLSEAQKKQRKENASKQKGRGRPKDLPSLNKKELKKLRKLNRKIKKTGSGRLGRENARRKKKEGGWKAVEDAAKDIVRHNLGITDEWLVDSLLAKLNYYRHVASVMDDCYKEVERQRSWLLFDVYEDIQATLYKMEQEINDNTKGKSFNETFAFRSSDDYGLIVVRYGHLCYELIRENKTKVKDAGVKDFFRKGKRKGK